MADVFVVALQHFGSIFCLDPEGDKKKKKNTPNIFILFYRVREKKAPVFVQTERTALRGHQNFPTRRRDKSNSNR
jgi:hypothetical protein